MEPQKFEPYVSPQTNQPEFTARSFLVGVILGIVFAVANAYLGLKVGLTVSSSIPAAIVGIAVFKVLGKKGSILENNIVQTVGSAGSIASGMIFTIPAFFLWQMDPGKLKIFFISLFGSFLGILFMIPLRSLLIAKEHQKLPYPEGTACAEVLMSFERKGGKAKVLFQGLGLGALYQLLMHENFLGLWKKEAAFELPFLKKAIFRMELAPELLGVGFIIGPYISSLMLAGGVLGALILTPLIAAIGANDPAIQMMTADAIRSKYVRMIGVGAVGAAGIFTLIKSLPTIVRSFSMGLKGYADRKRGGRVPRTELDLPFRFVLTGALLIALLMVVLPASVISVSPLGAFCVVLFSFFFVTVSSRVVGLVGVSSNPTSGMTIATLLMTTGLFILLGKVADITAAQIAILSVGGIVCTAASTAGDASQDLKTGFLVGATPRMQQIGQLLGSLLCALVLTFVIYLFRDDIMSGKLAAPQANLMATVIEGVLRQNIAWDLVMMGVLIGVILELLRLPSLAFAVGLYLPLAMSVPVAIGGLIRWVFQERRLRHKETLAEQEEDPGILYSSGLIAGAALAGVLVTALVALSQTSVVVKHWAEGLWNLTSGGGQILALGAFALLCWTLVRASGRAK